MKFDDYLVSVLWIVKDCGVQATSVATPAEIIFRLVADVCLCQNMCNGRVRTLSLFLNNHAGCCSEVFVSQSVSMFLCSVLSLNVPVDLCCQPAFAVLRSKDAQQCGHEVQWKYARWDMLRTMFLITRCNVIHLPDVRIRGSDISEYRVHPQA
jgi:hypothetical protein